MATFDNLLERANNKWKLDHGAYGTIVWGTEDVENVLDCLGKLTPENLEKAKDILSDPAVLRAFTEDLCQRGWEFIADTVANKLPDKED